MLSELKTSRKLVGMKQIRRALQEGKVQKVFLAADADPALTEPLAAQCEALGIPVCPVPSMVVAGRRLRDRRQSRCRGHRLVKLWS